MDNCQKWTLPVNAGNMLFTASQPNDFNPCNILVWGSDQVPYKFHSVELTSNADLPALDNAPGGFRTDITTVHAQLKNKLSAGDVTFNNPVKFPILSFVPTWSSLAMATPLNNTNLFVDLTTPEFFKENLPNIKVPNFNRFYAPPANLRHVELDEGMVALILEEIDLLEVNLHPGILTEEYNYGLEQKIIPTTTVSSTGILNINNAGPTGYVQQPNPGAAAVKPVFTTYLNQCGERITVEAGGIYILGSKDQSQHGITEVLNGATVQIKTGGQLIVNSAQSALVIKAGGTLVIEVGALIELSDLSQEDGGACIKIEAGGTLRIEGKFDLTGNGYFWLQGKEEEFPIYEDLRSAISWQGEDKNVRRLFLDEFPLPTDGKAVFIQNMQMDCRGIGGIDAKGSEVRIIDARIEGVGSSTEISGMGVTAMSGSVVLAQNTDFVHLRRGFTMLDMPNASVSFPLIDNCLFEDCVIGVLAHAVRQVNVRLSTFSQCKGTAIVLLEVASLANLIHSTIRRKRSQHDYFKCFG